VKPIEQEFVAKGVVRGGTLILPAHHALELVRCCRERGIRVLGLDGFALTETTTQPVMEHSTDYSWPNDNDAWSRAESFLAERIDSGLQFEVVVDQKHEEACIYVSLLGEGVDVWRPVRAEHFFNNVYRIVSHQHVPETETWEFEPGSAVVCEKIDSADGPIIAAVRRVNS
jgi:hypothetical protein